MSSERSDLRGILDQIEEFKARDRASRQETTEVAKSPAPARSATTPSSVTASTALPVWPASRRGIPNELVRCALFTVSTGQERKRFKNCPIAALRNRSVTYTGPELRQRDEDVYLQLLHIARGHPIADWVEFKTVDLLRAVGWTISGRSRSELRETIERLQEGILGITVVGDVSTRLFSHHLIRSFELTTSRIRKNEQWWRVKFEPEILSLYEGYTYTSLHWEQRLQLTPIGKWLHAWYSTHRQPLPMKVAMLHELSGSTDAHLPHFRAVLRALHQSLVAVGFLESWHLDERDRFNVVRAKTPSSGTALTPAAQA